MDKQLAKIIVKKMIAAGGMKTQEDLASFLGIKPQSISSNIARGSIPESWFDLFREKFGVSKGALLETPEEKLVRTYGKNPVTASVGVGWKEAKPRIASESDELNETDILDMIKMTADVLKSDTVYKPALASNIRAFYKAVTMEGEMKELKNDVREIKQQNADLREDLRALTEALLAAGIALPKRDTAA